MALTPDDSFILSIWMDTKHLHIDFSFVNMFHRCGSDSRLQDEGLIIVDDELVDINTIAESDEDNILSLRTSLHTGKLA